eukprot:UN23874
MNFTAGGIDLVSNTFRVKMLASNLQKIADVFVSQIVNHGGNSDLIRNNQTKVKRGNFGYSNVVLQRQKVLPPSDQFRVLGIIMHDTWGKRTSDGTKMCLIISDHTHGQHVVLVQSAKIDILKQF